MLMLAILMPSSLLYQQVHIGKGVGKPDGGKNCTTHSSDPYSSSLYSSSSSSIGTLFSVPPTSADDAAANAKPPAGSRIHVSPSLDGPCTCHSQLFSFAAFFLPMLTHWATSAVSRCSAAHPIAMLTWCALH